MLASLADAAIAGDACGVVVSVTIVLVLLLLLGRLLPLGLADDCEAACV